MLSSRIATLLALPAFFGSTAVAKTDVSAQIISAVGKAKIANCRGALDDLDPVWDRPDFAKMSDDQRIILYQIAVKCATTLKDRGAVYRYLVSGTAINGFPADLWVLRFYYELSDSRVPQAVDTLTAMMMRSPNALNKIDRQWMYALDRTLAGMGDKTLYRRFLIIVTSPSFQPEAPVFNTDFFKRSYAIMLVDGGESGAAAEVVSRMTSTSVLIKTSLDPKLRSFIPADFDARASMEQELAHLREIAKSHPDSLATKIAIAARQRQLGKPEEALATLNAADPSHPGNSFVDFDKQHAWWWDGMARTYLMLGRYDDMQHAYRAAMETGESDTGNVSQAINLAYGQLQFGRPTEALATIVAFRKAGYGTSPFGAMQLARVSGCAYFSAGRTGTASLDRDYMLAHFKDDPRSPMGLLACLGDIGGATKALTKWLGDPEYLGEALEEFSDFDQPPATAPQGPLEKSRDQLKLRPEVRAILDRAGGTRRFHLQREEF